METSQYVFYGQLQYLKTAWSISGLTSQRHTEIDDVFLSIGIVAIRLFLRDLFSPRVLECKDCYRQSSWDCPLLSAISLALQSLSSVFESFLCIQRLNWIGNCQIPFRGLSPWNKSLKIDAKRISKTKRFYIFLQSKFTSLSIR